MKELQGKVALVTGSSTGLGLAIALELGARGASVALNYAHRTDRAEMALANFTSSGAKGALFKADVTEADSVNQLVAEIKQELAPFGITTNLVSPCWIPTDRHQDAPQEHMDSYLQTIPAARWGQPEDVAQAVADFCSPRASFVTGQTLCVNGGRTLS